jgi:putative long chain acyl-CoA synthase
MLLASVRPSATSAATPLRGVFSRDDAWLGTGDLFRRDPDGDFWRQDSVGDVIRTAEGPVFTTAIRDALGDLPAVGLAVAYGVRPVGGEHELAVAAVTLRAGHELDGGEVSGALRGLAPEERPGIVHVVDSIPLTTWFRPLTAALRQAGLPQPGAGRQAWYRDRSGRAYRPLTDAARRRLTSRAA